MRVLGRLTVDLPYAIHSRGHDGAADDRMTLNGHVVRLQFCSAFDMLDIVQVVSDYLCRRVGFDEDSMHWVGVAVRESVINAIKHGNHNDQSKLVHVEFTSSTDTGELAVSIRDEGEGFDPGTVADPLAPENMLKSSGRGIFLMRNFMDDVELRRVPGGGMEVRMVKKLSKAEHL
jgi:serine/threonine-protein kinase RsbW